MRPSIILALLCVLGLSACDKPNTPMSDTRWTPEITWREANSTFESAGRTLTPVRVWRFDGSHQGFSATTAILTGAAGGGLRLTPTGPNPILRSPPDLALSGARGALVLVRLTRVKAGGPWNGVLYYSTPEHGEQAGFMGRPLVLQDPILNQPTILVYDMSHQAIGAGDWTRSRISQFRLDTDIAPGGEFVIHQMAVVEDPRFLPQTTPR